MGVYDEACDTKLALGIGLGNSLPKSGGDQEEELNDPLSLNLSFGVGASSCWAINISESSKNSSSNDEEEGDNNNKNNGSRKKLRLTKEQSCVLEDNFKEHTTLNTAQKNNLAAMLNLKPRQVEVWFQNRRARTKLKQTETDCERWKRSCEELTDENKRLKKEIGELRTLKIKERTALFNLTSKTNNETTSDSVCPSCCCCWRVESNRGNGEAAPCVAVDVVLEPKHEQSGLKMHS